jgi:hypothetical protein
MILENPGAVRPIAQRGLTIPQNKPVNGQIVPAVSRRIYDKHSLGASMGIFLLNQRGKEECPKEKGTDSDLTTVPNCKYASDPSY